MAAATFVDNNGYTVTGGALAEPDTEEVEEEEPEEEEEEEEADEEAEEDQEVGGGETEEVAVVEEEKRWPGWPGDTVYRMIVPVLKVGSIIGRKGELIKKLCEDTRARVKILDGDPNTTDRIVLISAKEDPEVEVPPAVDALLRVFKRVNTITEGEGGNLMGPPLCSVRLLVASTQAISLIGKQGATIKSIQESSGAQVRVLHGDELPSYATTDERIVDIQGEPSKVFNALEAVACYLRKFLVDHGVLPLFEKQISLPAARERKVDATLQITHSAEQPAIGSDYRLSHKRDSYLDRETPVGVHYARSGLSLYGQDPALSSLRSSGLGRGIGALVTQITQMMQIPLSYAEDIIGIGGTTIARIRSTSGAFLSVQETRGVPDEITVEIKGTSTQVQHAQQLIQDAVAGRRDHLGSGGAYGSLDTGYRSSFSSFKNTSDYLPSSSSSLSSEYGGYSSAAGLGGYRSYRY